MEIHEAANIFPLDESSIFELAKDINKNGLLKPIELYQGKIIDGRRRFQACQQCGIDPDFVDVSPEDPIAYSWSLNGPRRHCTPSQLAMVGARMREMYDAQAKERMVRGKKSDPVENLPQGSARDAVGKVVGVSGKSIDYATKVLKQGVPELAKAVDEGRMAISTAAVLATEPPEKQLEEVSQPKRNRTYKPSHGGGNGKPVSKSKEEEQVPEGERRGKGVILANEAINCLIRIPKNDALRNRGFQLVTDWIRRNK